MHTIRIAMLGGVLLFGGVSWMLQRTPGWSPAPAADVETLKRLAPVFWAVAIAGVGVLFVQARRVTDPARRGTFAVVAWALGEMVALYGGVIYFLAGDARGYLLGLLFLALSLTIFPAPRAPRR